MQAINEKRWRFAYFGKLPQAAFSAFFCLMRQQILLAGMDNRNHSKEPPSLADLYPSLTSEELKEAEENLTRYLELCWQIFLRIQNDPVEYARFKALTAKYKPHTIKGAGPKPS